ncbi:MAG: sigma 54-interacting transcriptional regulator, partial [Gammaproteobacteria bacterium]
MPSGTPILLIDADARRAELAGAVFHFLGEEFAHRTAPPAAGSAACAMALLAADGDPAELSSTVEALRSGDAALPIALLRAPADLDPESLGAVASLGWPLRHDELLSALYLGRIYREQRDQGRERGGATRLFRALVGQSAGLQAVRRMMGQVADTEATVLVLGESGTGKEVVARSLHEHSRRRSGPFVPVNCGAIPADLLESELFGHEKGAFTGAVTARAGRFELARGGTLFLDEIGDMPLTMQVKLLRVIQERRFERVGGSQTLEADVRIVCATHKDLEQMIAKGSFREDLFYRINVFPIELPPLRERAEDLALLVNE